MILSEFIRVMDLGWETFLWGCLWVSIVIGIYTAVIMGTTWFSARSAFIKNELPGLHNNIVALQTEEIKSLKGELRMALADRQDYKDRLLAIKNSSEVRGI